MSETKKTCQFVAAVGATMGGFCLGTVIGWMSPASRLISESGISKDNISWIGSIMTLGAALALVILFFVFDLMGRKILMIAMAPPFVVAWVILAFFDTLPLLLLGRALCGLCGAIFCVAAPTFTAEIAQKDIRGMLGVFFQLFITLGILFAYCLGETNDLMFLSLPNCVFPVISAVIIIFMKETPVYYIKKGKEDKAAASLQFYRGKEANISGEMAEMNAYAKQGSETFCEVFKLQPTIKAFIMITTLHAIQQLSGINAVMFFAYDIFQSAGSELPAGICSIILGVVQVIATVISAVLVDRIGRKILWLISLAVMGICQLLLGLFFIIKDNDPQVAEDIGWLPLVSLCLYIVGFSLGAGPLPWAMLGELMPNRVKGPVSSFVGFLNWMLAFLVTCSFIPLLDLIGAAIVFWVFAVVCVLGFVFVLFFVIETRGKTLEEIQKILGGGQ